jgi:hypothetical protein
VVPDPLALALMALALGGGLAALLTQVSGFSISAMGVAMPVLLFGVLALLEQQMVSPFAGQTWVYAALLALWGRVRAPSGQQRLAVRSLSGCPGP